MSNNILPNHNVNTAIIVVLLAIFISVIYFPKSIWDEEADLRDEARFRMHTVTLAEKLHYQLAKAYTSDMHQLVRVVNGVRDSLMAAELDTNYNYYGPQLVALPARDLNVDYSQDYAQSYMDEHLKLFKRLTPHHYMEPELIAHMLDSIRTRFDAGNFTGEQTMEIDSTVLSFTVSDKFDILFQNIKTTMFNALTGSYTKYPNFSVPLVDAVLDSITKNPELAGRVDFENVYDGSVRIDYLIPSNFSENMEKTKLQLKKQLVIDSYDSATYGDTLYTMAVDEFMAHLDTSDAILDELLLFYTDTSETIIDIPVQIKVEEMAAALAKRRNRLYTLLTGYAEPNQHIAEIVISKAMESLDSYDSMYVDIDLTDVTFNININRNTSTYFNKVNLDQAYYKTFANLSDLAWDSAGVSVVETVAEKMRKSSDYNGWQVVEAPQDTFWVNIPDNFLRIYDDMNMRLAEGLTGEFTNVFDEAHDIVSLAQHLASVDSLNWSGKQLLQLPADTIEIDVFPTYLDEYRHTFVIPRDTVVQGDDSSFIIVYDREDVAVHQEFEIDSLPFLIPGDNSEYTYTFEGADSVKGINVIEKSDTARAELVFYNYDVFVMLYKEDSTMENLYQLTDMFTNYDSMQVDTLDVVSDEVIVGQQEKEIYAKRDSVWGFLDTTINKKYMKQELLGEYNFVKEHTLCPVTEKPYRVTIRSNVHQIVESPIVEPISKRRYLFFSQTDSSHGYIEDGEVSWDK